MLAKLAAGREHDLEFAADALREGLVDPDQLRVGVDLIPESHREPTKKRLLVLLARHSR